MSAKIRELKLEDIKTVAGGVKTMAMSSNLLYASTSSQLIKPTATMSVSPTYQFSTQLTVSRIV